ncbi:D-alanine--D-alanine ligase [Candidatus Uhrbacteria bacterium]|nr:D-alanine--D-alanine ligase [Candidatus Uhrbacteria bacterium]
MRPLKGKKIKLGIIFGGRSPEHEVSLVSAASVMAALDHKKYDVTPVWINKNGKWFAGKNALEFAKGNRAANVQEVIFKAVPGSAQLVGQNFKKKLDVIFPVLHGPFGEDGTIQGLFEFADTPYVGCGVLSGAIGMDKAIQKQIFSYAGLPVAPWIEIKKSEFERNKLLFYKRARRLGLPIFVKPSNMGSSVGVSKVKEAAELQKAINGAFLYDRKILIEKAIDSAREIECAVLGGSEPVASALGEIKSSGDFYDYAAKYIDGRSKAIIPADLPLKIRDKIRKMAIKCFKICSCAGLARVDFLFDGKTFSPYLNEINTLPGFTSISMYPKLWEASGIGLKELIDKLVEISLEDYRQKKILTRSYFGSGKWWRGN